MKIGRKLNHNKVKGYTYTEFTKLMADLVKAGKTTGEKQSESLANFTALNLKRMQRIEKTFSLNEELFQSANDFPIKQNLVVITEAWCGDSAQTLPLIQKISEKGNANLKIILRDEHPEWIEKYHTNGSRSIPKLISFDAEGNELFTWGPRSQPARQLLVEWKKNKETSGKGWGEFERELHTWYARDKGQTLQTEFAELQMKTGLQKPKAA